MAPGLNSAADPEPDQIVDVDAIVIGAGFAGLYQLHLLRDRLGLSTVVLEAAEGVGGTWHWNRYPGARCDSESHGYCYFFSKELWQSWEWSERYPSQPEILRYLNHVADRFDLRRSIRFGRRVVSATYLGDRNRWLVTDEGGARYRSHYVICAVGCLSTANVPDIAGLQDFAGEWYHTGQWPHEGVDFAGKRVGQIGTGSTGIQSVPVIAQTAAHLTVFQRTPNYSVPARNTRLSEAFKRHVRASHDEIRDLVRSTPSGHPFGLSPRKALETPPEERSVIYEEAWNIGGLRFRSCFHDLVLDKAANDTAADFLKAKIRNIVDDPDTAAKLSDIDHPYGAKRPPIDSQYFETFNRDNVTLVDVRADPIDRIVPDGLWTRSTHHPLDLLVVATGFDAMTGPLLAIDIRGRDNLALRDAWSDGPRTFLGLMVPGFPNMFTVTGPGSPSVLTNMPVAIEQHVEWIADCIAHLRDEGVDRIEARREQTDRWVAHVNEVANGTLLPSVAHSWYLGANIPGKPRVFMPYAGGMARYRDICDGVAAAGYSRFILGDGTITTGGGQAEAGLRSGPVPAPRGSMETDR